MFSLILGQAAALALSIFSGLKYFFLHWKPDVRFRFLWHPRLMHLFSSVESVVGGCCNSVTSVCVEPSMKLAPRSVVSTPIDVESTKAGDKMRVDNIAPMKKRILTRDFVV